MSDYHQPSFYRFNQDSILLAKYVIERIPTVSRILDLGAGSGVIGLELAKFFLPKVLTLVEVQKEYEEILKKNICDFIPNETSCEVIISSFKEFSSKEQWDLIVCNPPYYFPESGQPSHNQQKNIARSFVIDNWEILLKTVSLHLSPNGKAFIVIKNDKKIKEKILEIMPAELSISFDERGDLVFLSCLHKN